MILAALLLFILTEVAATAQTIHLPESFCMGADSIFADGFEPAPFVSDPSLGNGGGYPGSASRSFTFQTFGTMTYYVYVPAQYQPGRAMPLMVVLHGAAGSPALADQNAQYLRDKWIVPANAYGFIVLAPVSNGSHGSWVAPPPYPNAAINDYDLIAAVLSDLNQAYNVERNRVSVWGFSAGGHVVWDMLLNNGEYVRPTPLNAGNLASMSISGANSHFACSLDATPCATRFGNLPRKVPVDIHIGNADGNYPWAADDYQRLLTNGWVPGDTVSYHLFVGGHTYTSAHLQQIAKFACGFAVQPQGLPLGGLPRSSRGHGPLVQNLSPPQ